MNAKQRRIDARKWRYHVRLTISKAAINGYLNMWYWCRDQFGHADGGWREEHYHYGTCWQFSDEKKAVLFALRWS